MNLRGVFENILIESLCVCDAFSQQEFSFCTHSQDKY